jgi:hypothetical protein
MGDRRRGGPPSQQRSMEYRIESYVEELVDALMCSEASWYTTSSSIAQVVGGGHRHCNIINV